MTDGLVAFLRARLDDDERVAQEAAKMAGGQRWVARYHVITQKPEPGRSGDTIAECAPFGGRYVAAHIRRHDPARVLAEVEAKRSILQLHGGVILRGGPGAKYYDTTTVCKSCEPPQFAENAWPCPMLRLLALPYGAHPDYQPDWAPKERG